MLGSATKRFYKEAGIAPEGDGYSVTLDGRPLRTPGGAPLTAPTRALAIAVSEEWAAQDTQIRPHTMPLTQLTNTAIDRVAHERTDIVERMMAYAATDLLCYRAEFPPDLAVRQQANWQPLLDWVADTHGARLTVADGVIPVPQSPSALAALGAAVAVLDDIELTALACIAAATGSLVIALALTSGRIDAEAAYEVSRLDEAYQVERWGEDAEAVARQAGLRADIFAAARFLALGHA